MTKKYLINTANLHIGGGVQVASSFISEISKIDANYQNISLCLSDEVSENIENMSLTSTFFDRILPIDVHGFGNPAKSDWKFLDEFDSVFTVFGPLYKWKTPFKNIIGFAQPWIIYPDNEVYDSLSFIERIKLKVKFFIQAHFFKRADILIVELEHVKEGLIRELGIDPDRIHVVHNCVSALYHCDDLWEPVDMPQRHGFLKLGFVGRNYVHKNTKIFSEIVHCLKNDHGIDALFYVTFTPEEWQACSPGFRKVCVNIGPLRAAQCPRFYESLDAVVFPSLLESFSATPLEALSMSKPLFASDRPFNRDICGDFACYFDPVCARDAADKIAAAFAGDGPDQAWIEQARQHALNFSTPADRAHKYLNILRNS